MTIIWIIVAISGVLAGLAVSRAALTSSRLSSANGRRDVAIMASVWAMLMLAFLIAPLVRIPLDTYFQQTSSWRLFGIYDYSSVLAVCFFSTCLMLTLVRGFKLLLGGVPGNGP